MLRRRIAAVLVAAATLVAVAAVPAAADVDHATTYYLALGDSLAYGYQPVAPLDRTQGYVDRLHTALVASQPKLQLQNLGCPGETTGTLLNGGICDYLGSGSQIVAAERYLLAHKDKVRLVTIDIGANDLDRCVSGASLDQQCVLQGLGDIAVNLAQIVTRLRAAAPNTRIVGMTYYDPFLADYLTGPAGQQLATQSLQITGILNLLLSGEYRLGGFDVADVAAAFSTSDMATVVTVPGLGAVPLDVARICQWTWMCTVPPGPDIHANKAGYQVIADTFAAGEH